MIAQRNLANVRRLAREAIAVDAYLSPEACRMKALDCMIKADALDDPVQRAAMLQYAEWWDRLAQYRERVALDRNSGTESQSGTVA